jgi:hypothetical protein
VVVAKAASLPLEACPKEKAGLAVVLLTASTPPNPPKAVAAAFAKGVGELDSLEGGGVGVIDSIFVMGMSEIVLTGIGLAVETLPPSIDASFPVNGME